MMRVGSNQEVGWLKRLLFIKINKCLRMKRKKNNNGGGRTRRMEEEGATEF